MVLAIDVIDRHGPSSKMRRQLQPKKTKVRLYRIRVGRFTGFTVIPVSHFSRLDNQQHFKTLVSQ